ncbi:unnamed protein product [Rotaria magnacalcarata]|uniref:Uncharacterized protein n=2 Tax=Rotaria magnacalcarata TaxID=392030 RepID=A0A814L746_9BILA|nr:unnamed protein product [Rotaria magnacalcarata]
MSTVQQSFQVSEFYLACRNGDVDTLKRYLMTFKETIDDLNPLEPSANSTPLHAASFYGHTDIVQILLEHGCDRSKVNGYCLTAYEEAANDEIRQLFKRCYAPNCSGRFQEESTEDCFDFVQRPKQIKKENPTLVAKSHSKTPKSQPLQTFRTKTEKKLEIGYATTSITMCQSRLGRFITDKLRKDAPMSLKTMGNRLQDILDRELIANNDPESSKANQLLKNFLTDNPTERLKHLIRLYTLETKFYRFLRQNPMPLALPLYVELQNLKDRFYQGQSYRGARMADDEIATYESAARNQGSLLQSKIFSSTSLQRSTAEDFADAANKASGNIRKNRVLFIFDFPQPCDQAINLSRISDAQPCLSEFEDEAEVLILPWALFQVENVHKESPTSCIINLTNVILPHNNLFSSFKWILKHPKGSINRLNEHFPEIKPEFTVNQLKHVGSIFDPPCEEE